MLRTRLQFACKLASGIAGLLAVGCSTKHITEDGPYDAGPTPSTTMDASSSGDGATSSAPRPSDAVPKLRDASPDLPDGPSICGPLVCPDDGGCPKFAWPFDPQGSECDPGGIGIAHGYSPPVMYVGCGLVVVMANLGPFGNHSETIYDEATGDELGTRQGAVMSGGWKCEDSRPDVRRRITTPQEAPICDSARLCHPCQVTGTPSRPVYTCQPLGSTQFYQWSPFDTN